MTNMDEYIPQLTKAIQTRQSKRKYHTIPLKEDHRRHMQEFLNYLNVPFTHDVHITLHHNPKDAPAFYFTKMNTTDTFAAFTSTKTVYDQATTGFIGELFILFCESIGVSTCWTGHYKTVNVNKIVQPHDKWVACTTPLGYAEEKQGLAEKLFSKKKKTVEDNLQKSSLTTFPDFIRNALQLSCLAPSAMNNQCWTFDVHQERTMYTIAINKPAGYQHFKWHYTDIDVGTAACHFWLGMMNQKIPCQITLEERQNQAVWIFTTPSNQKD